MHKYLEMNICKLFFSSIAHLKCTLRQANVPLGVDVPQVGNLCNRQIGCKMHWILQTRATKAV